MSRADILRVADYLGHILEAIEHYHPQFSADHADVPELHAQISSLPDKINRNNLTSRHSGAGRNPVKQNRPRMRVTFAPAPGGQKQDVVPLTWELFRYLDSGLRRNDAFLLMDNPG